jgi:hypothetical protein
MNPKTIYGGIAALFNFTLVGCDASQGGSVRARLVGGTTSTDIETSDVTGTGPNWIVTVPAAATATLAAGPYTLLILATPLGGVETVTGQSAIDLLAADAKDLRSSARKILDALEAMFEGKASKDQASISYNGRSISRLSLDEVQAAIAKQKRIVKTEENRAAGKGRVQSVALGFSNV